MSAVKNLKFSILIISLFLFLFTVPVIADTSFEINVYGVDTSPHTVEEGEDVTISGYVGLENASSGSHTVAVKWYVDDDLEHTEDHLMEKGDTKHVDWNFDTSGLSEGTHDVKIKAFVESATDEDVDHFYVEEENIEITVDDFDVYPETLCIDEEEIVEFSVRVRLEKGPDNTLVTAKFYVEDDGGWDYINKDTERLDEDERETLGIDAYYYGYDLDEGTLDVKVVVEAGDEKETEYSTLRVKECYPDVDYDIEVGYISLNPQYPEFGENIHAKVPIDLQSAPDLPQNVRVRVFIDGRSTYSSNIWFYHLEKKTYSFNIHTLEFDPGIHTVDVTATVDGTSDSSKRSFTIGPGQIIPGYDCLSITEILSDKPLKAGDQAVIDVKLTNCGSITEYNIKASLTAFSKTYFSDIYSITPGAVYDVQFTVQVPEDATGFTNVVARIYNSYTSDSKSKDFTIHTGVPSIQIKSEYQVEDCKINEFTFQVTNVGEVTDTFSLSVEGQASEWITGIPETITLEPDEKKIVNVYANIPCDTNEGKYQFTVKVKNSEVYSVSSNLNVKRGWAWPTLPTGFITTTGTLLWIPWLLLLILIIVLYIIYLEYVKERKKPMF